MVFYDNGVSFSKVTTITNNCVEFIIMLFNKYTHKTINMVIIYKPPKMGILIFLSILKKMLIDIPLNCPIVIIRNVNVNMLLKALKSTMVEIFMNKYKFLIFFGMYYYL